MSDLPAPHRHIRSRRAADTAAVTWTSWSWSPPRWASCAALTRPPWRATGPDRATPCPATIRLARPGRRARSGLLILALRYVGLIGGLVALAVIVGAPPVLATAAGLVGALLGTVVAR